MKVQIAVGDASQESTDYQYDLPDSTAVSELANRLAADLGWDSEEVLELLASERAEALPRTVSDLEGHAQAVKLRVVCVELHFTSEQAQRRFSPKATWADVHRFGCKRFHVPPTDCPHLELHESEPTGPLLNEQNKLGQFKGCKVVWLVSPGPEANG
jgi:hypothetical protein